MNAEPKTRDIVKTGVVVTPRLRRLGFEITGRDEAELICGLERIRACLLEKTKPPCRPEE